MYTKKLFNVFQDELQLSSSYYIVRVEGDNLLDVVPYGHCPHHLYDERTFRVPTNSADGLYSGDTCKFQRDGVLCCHILKVFDALVVHEVPCHYIFPCWSAEKVNEAAAGHANFKPGEACCPLPYNLHQLCPVRTTFHG